MNTTRNRDSVWTMLRQAEAPDANQLVDAFETADGLLCIIIRVRNSHYNGYVQLPDFVFKANGGTWPSQATIERHWGCRPPNGEISYGPDKSGWIGFDTNRTPEDICLGVDGEPLPNNFWADYDVGFLGEEIEPRNWTPESVRAALDDWADGLADVLYQMREGDYGDYLPGRQEWESP